MLSKDRIKDFLDTASSPDLTDAECTDLAMEVLDLRQFRDAILSAWGGSASERDAVVGLLVRLEVRKLTIP